MEPPSLKLRSSMKGRTKKIVLAFHGAPKQVVRGIHKRPNAFLLWPIHKKSKKVEHKKNCAWPLLELSNSKFESSTKSWTQNFFVFSPFGASELQVQKLHKELSIKKLHLGPLQAFELWAQKLPHLPSAISLHLVSNFWHQKLEVKYNVFLRWPFLELSSSKLGSSKRGRCKSFYAQPPTFGAESWRPSAKVFVSASLTTFELGTWKLQERLMQIFLPWLSSKES